jgi:hypothetical protein
MEHMLGVMADNPATAVAGLIATVCFASSPLFRARWKMLMGCIVNNLGFALHYALLGDWTAAAMNGVMGVQTVVAMMLVRQPGLRWAYYALMPVLALASVVTWDGPPSFLSAGATTLSTLGRMQTNETVLRVFLLASNAVLGRPRSDRRLRSGAHRRCSWHGDRRNDLGGPAPENARSPWSHTRTLRRRAVILRGFPVVHRAATA